MSNEFVRFEECAFLPCKYTVDISASHHPIYVSNDLRGRFNEPANSSRAFTSVVKQCVYKGNVVE